MALKAVLFDLDDTLYDHQHCARSGLAALQGRYASLQAATLDELIEQHAALMDVYHTRVLRGEITLDEARLGRFSDLLGRYGETNARDVTRLYRETYLGAERATAGGLALLRRLRADGLKLGLVTNNTVVEQMGKLERLGLMGLFDALAISEAVGCAKPDTRIFEHVLAALGCAADEVVMVGDSWSADVVGAQAAGIRAVWLNRYGRARPDDTQAAEIQAFEPLDAVIEAITGKAG
jgi:putative hydrolase of the HAD superfamily